MNKRTLYLECNSGLSGDMFTAALLDLGADEAVLRKALASLPLDGFDIKISRVKNPGWTPVILTWCWTPPTRTTTTTWRTSTATTTHIAICMNITMTTTIPIATRMTMPTATTIIITSTAGWRKSSISSPVQI